MKVYLQLLKQTPMRSFFAAYTVQPDGSMANLWPTESHDEKAAQREGFFFTTSSRVCPVGYSIMIEEVGTSHPFLASQTVQKILRNRGLDVTDLEVYTLTGTSPQQVNN